MWQSLYLQKIVKQMNDINNLLETLADEYSHNYPREVANYCEQISATGAAEIIDSIADKYIENIWFHLNSSTKEDIFSLLPISTATNLLNKIDIAPSAALLINLDSKKQHIYLSQLDPIYARYIEDFISYPENSAASMMDRARHVYQGNITVLELLKHFKKGKITPSSYIYLVDSQNIISGRVNIQNLLTADDEQTLLSLSKKVPVTISAFAPRSEVLETFEQTKIDSLPVVDSLGHVIGLIYATKIFEELKDELATDIQTMVGVSRDETALSPSLFAVKLRLPWLLINLVTAFMAATVVGIFEGTIQKVTALAVLLPVVAGQSGNAGAQALAVTMRGLAVREFAVTQYWQVLRKEALVGLITSILVAVVCGIGVYIWSTSYALALVLSISMIISVSIACISGVLVPIILRRLHQDPAQSSSIILTTITDIIGFFSFLGIATLMLSFISV